ncbi:MAG: GAF domain-containing protein, partial [Clostridiaceae bacterium]|nr:GAF domain-containing protein [Clostridiaceae bacterium]
MISHISTGLIRVDKTEIDSKFTEMLGMCGQYFQADRSYLFMIAKSSRSMSCKHKWGNTAASSAPDLTSDLVAETIFHLAADHDSHEPMRVNNVTTLGVRDPSGKIYQSLDQAGAKSLMVIPIMSKTSIIGFWWLDTVDEDKTWTDDHAKQLGVIANILADTLAKVDAEREIYQMALYD